MFLFSLKSTLFFYQTTDVAIQTNSSDKAKIYLRAGQKVIVLKSPKGVCLQLQSGKIIAIRSSQKPGLPSLGSMSAVKVGEPRPPPRQDGDVIDISNDDDEDESSDSTKKDSSDLNNVFETSPPNENGIAKPVEPPKADNMYKENRYKPNLLPRKPKVLSSTSSLVPPISQPMQNSMQKPSRWDTPPSSYSNNSSGSSYHRNGNTPYRSENCEFESCRQFHVLQHFFFFFLNY
jgi:hypothetical protein